MSQSHKLRIPWEAVSDDGLVASGYNNVLNIWKEHFSKLLNAEIEAAVEVKLKKILETQSDSILDSEISMTEISASLAKAKMVKQLAEM